MDALPPLFAPGQRLGRYELLQRLAVGGMAEVYLAYASGPGDFRKVVAIKRMLPQHALDPQLLRMFLDEARLMARLGHPNVPQVIDVDDGEVPYFVMEYVHGTDLRGILNAAEGALPLETALTITVAVAAGLHHAHELRGAAGQELGIVHRDVSPSNVLVSFDGGVKVTDFGVAKWAEQKSFTHQGQLKGKFAHMSPEQCRGEVLDRRSDVFALGTLLYEMTTGAPPFVAESEYELLTQIVQRDAPPPVRPGEDYPAELRAIVMRSLSRARDGRQSNAQQLQLELEAFAREHRLVVSPVALAEYLEALFGARVTEWREALRSGQTLADHLQERGGHARPDGTADGPGQRRAGTPGPERTATDVFTLGQGHGPVASGASPATTVPRVGGGMGRKLAVGVAAAGALVALVAATEATSRWQRESRHALDPVLTRTTDVAAPAAPAPAPAAAMVDTAGADGIQRAPEPATTAEDRSSAPEPRLAAAERSTVSRRGRDPAPVARTGARRELAAPARRGSGGAAPAEPGDDTERERRVGTVVGSRRQPAGSPDNAPPAAPRPAAPPTEPVKVWDPDSPVPP